MDWSCNEATFSEIKFDKANKYQANITFKAEITVADINDIFRLLRSTGRLTYTALVEPPPLTPRQQMAAGQLTLDQADTVGEEPVPASEAATTPLTPEQIAAKVAAVLDLLETHEGEVDPADLRLALDFAKAAQAKGVAGEAITPEEARATAHVEELTMLVEKLAEKMAQPAPEGDVATPEGPVGKGDVPDAFKEAFDEQPPQDEPKETRQDEAAE